MKRIIIVFIIFCGCLNTFSQARLGSYLSELKLEYRNQKTEFLLIDNIPCFVVSYSNVDIFYYLTDKGTCFKTALATDNRALVETIIQIYNKYHVIKSRTSWLMNDKGKYIRINLQYINNVGYVFTWD